MTPDRDNLRAKAALCAEKWRAEGAEWEVANAVPGLLDQLAAAEAERDRLAADAHSCPDCSAPCRWCRCVQKKIGELESRAEAAEARVARLREALQAAAARCPDCGGTGKENVGGMMMSEPVYVLVECLTCAGLRQALEETAQL